MSRVTPSQKRKTDPRQTRRVRRQLFNEGTPADSTTYEDDGEISDIDVDDVGGQEVDVSAGNTSAFGRTSSTAGNAISDHPYAWGIPKSLLEYKTITLELEMVSPTMNLSLTSDKVVVLPCIFLDHFIQGNNKFTLQSLIPDHVFKIPKWEMELLYCAGTREQITISGSTQYKSRDFINVPLLCGEVPQNARFLFKGIVNPITGGNQYLVPSIASFLSRPVNVTQDENTFVYNPIKCGESCKRSGHQNIDQWVILSKGYNVLYTELETNDGTTFTATGDSSLCPLYTQQTTNPPNPFIHTPYVATPGEWPQEEAMIFNKTKPIPTFILSAPDVLGEDDTSMKFNYTVRVKTKMIVHATTRNLAIPRTTTSGYLPYLKSPAVNLWGAAKDGINGIDWSQTDLPYTTNEGSAAIAGAGLILGNQARYGGTTTLNIG